jgi:malate dehydrogenase (quinone)
MTNKNNTYEVAIIGAGVCGTALLYTLSKYTNINKIALIRTQIVIAKLFILVILKLTIR